MNGKMVLPLLRPGRHNKSLNIFGILRKVCEYLRKVWPHTVIELRDNSHFCSLEFMDWAYNLPYPVGSILETYLRDLWRALMAKTMSTTMPMAIPIAHHLESLFCSLSITATIVS